MKPELTIGSMSICTGDAPGTAGFTGEADAVPALRRPLPDAGAAPSATGRASAGSVGRTLPDVRPAAVRFDAVRLMRARLPRWYRAFRKISAGCPPASLRTPFQCSCPIAGYD